MRTETRQSFILIGGTGVTALLSVVYAVYAQNALGPSRSADLVAALSFVALCQIALGPINGTVTRFAAQFAGRQEWGKVRSLSGEMTKRVALYGVPVLLLGLLAVKPLVNFWQFESAWSLLIAFAMVYATLLLSVARGVLRGLLAFGSYNINTVLEAAVRLALGLVILNLVLTPTAALLAYLGALLVIVVFSQAQLARRWRGYRPVPVDGQSVIRFAAPLLVMMLTAAGFENVDMLTVKRCFPQEAAGVYGAAFTLARVISTMVTPFTTLLLPLLTTLHEQKRPLAGTFLRVSGYFLVLAAVPLMLFGLWSDRIVGLLYTEEFAGAAAVLLPVTVARLLGYVCHMIALVGAATNNFRFLYVYLPCLAGQASLLAIWHDSLDTVASLLVVGHAVTLLMLATFVLVRRASRQATTPIASS